ncbi:MAG: hypothetical protein WA139_03805 [Candidatus Aenigmatarchaeota archaeon]
MVTPIDAIIISWREAGLPLLFLWMLTLAIVYGVLSHTKLPNSNSARGVISIVAAFLVLFAAAATQVTAFLSSIVTSFVAIAFGLLLIIIFLEMTGTKIADKHVFSAHPRFFATIIILIGVAIFVGAAQVTGLFNFNIIISDTILGMVFFLAIIIVAMWALMKENDGKS